MTTRRSQRAVPALVLGLALLVAACDETLAPLGPPDPPNLATVQDTVRQLELWLAATTPEVLALPRTVFSARDRSSNRLVFGVEEPAVVHVVAGLLERLGIPRWSYEIQLADPIFPDETTLRTRHRPTPAGIQLNFHRSDGSWVCSLGFNVQHSGGRSFITNSHCTAERSVNTGTPFYQPSSTTEPQAIGLEVDDPPLFTGGICPVGRRCRYSDAARVLYDGGTESSQGRIARTTGVNNGELDVAGHFTIVSQADTATTFTGSLDKVGRTTGWTRGEVSHTCAHVNVGGTDLTMLCQTIVTGTNLSAGGDSGSPWFRIVDGDDVELVGIHWGGSGGTSAVFSPLRNVVLELGSMTATTPPATSPPLAPATLTATVVSSSQVELEWPAVAGADGLQLQRRIPNVTSFETIATPDGSATGHSDTGTSPETTYRYRIRACNGDGCSAWVLSNVITTPAEPSGPPAAPTDVSTTAVSSTRADVLWTDASTNETHFQIQRRTRVDGTWSSWAAAGVAGSNSTTFPDEGLAPETTYRHRVRACNDDGCSSWVTSNTVTTPVGGPPAAPTDVITSVVSSTRADLLWTDTSTNETHFQIQRRTRVDGTWSTWAAAGVAGSNSTTFPDEDLEPETTYRHRVRACNDDGCSSWGLSNVVTTPAP
jgi:hypothetical protein